MRLIALDADSRREVLETLCKLPPDVRRFAIEHLAFTGVGREARGVAISPGATEGRWTIVLLERDGIGLTAAHEVAHALRGDALGSVEAERGAAGLAASWGFSGSSTDPDRCAAAFEDMVRQRGAVQVRSTVLDGGLAFECATCGGACLIHAPTVPGLAAEVGVTCEACESCLIVDVGSAATCPGCDAGDVAATWANEATPEHPLMLVACGCGRSVAMPLRSAPPREPDTESAWALRAARRALAGLAGPLRALVAQVPDADPVAREAVRVGAWHARQRLLRLDRLRNGDGAALGDLAAQVGGAAEAIQRDDYAGAADTLATVASALAGLTTHGNGSDAGRGSAVNGRGRVTLPTRGAHPERDAPPRPGPTSPTGPCDS